MRIAGWNAGNLLAAGSTEKTHPDATSGQYYQVLCFSHNGLRVKDQVSSNINQQRANKQTEKIQYSSSGNEGELIQ